MDITIEEYIVGGCQQQYRKEKQSFSLHAEVKNKLSMIQTIKIEDKSLSLKKVVY